MEVLNYDVVQGIEPDILLAVATPVEKDSVIAVMQPMEDRTEIVKVLWEEAVYYLGRCGSYDVALVMSEAGSGGRDGSILATKTAIDRWNPRAVVMPGIAFGKNLDDRKQIFGDVLVSKMVYPYEPQRLGVDQEVDRGPRPEAGLTLFNRAKHLDWTWERVPGSGRHRRPIIGPILSGEKLVDNPEFKRQLFERFPEAIGGEMEGGGIYAAAERAGIEWVLAKAICDWGDGSKHKKYQAVAAGNAARFVRAFLSEPGLECLARAKQVQPVEREVSAAISSAEKLSQRIVFEEARRMIRETDRERQRTGEELRGLLAPHFTEERGLEVPGKLRPLVESTQAAHEGAVERWLNAYSDTCAHFVTGSVEADLFTDAFGQEVIELIDIKGEHSRRLHPRESSAYGTIWSAYDLLKEDD